MNKHPIHVLCDEESRQDWLITMIEEIFGYLAHDEIDAMAAECSRSETRMLEVVRINRRSIALMDLYEDLEFKPVHFPKELVPYLREGDVFLTTIGRKKSKWVVLHLSPCYEDLILEEQLH